MKKAVLRGVSLVFSGLIALGVRSQDSEYWKLADTFGAECTTNLKAQTTHVVANQVSYLSSAVMLCLDRLTKFCFHALILEWN